MRENPCYGFATQRGKGIVPGFDGLLYKNTLAGYHHLHSAAAPEWAENMVSLAMAHQKNRQ